jgi:hypothetical protein
VRYLVAAYVIGVAGIAGYALWLIRERNALRGALGAKRG